jgi:heme/copper-type cytochrome/quinol oxidase subunit 3
MTTALAPDRPAALTAAETLSRPTGWWAMVLVIATEATLFVLLVATYFYLRVETHGSWPPPPHSDPKIVRPLIATLVLVAGSIPMLLATRSAVSGRAGLIRGGLVGAVVCGLAFLVFQAVLVHDSLALFRPQDDAYSSIYYTLIGVHYVHAVIGVLLALWALARVSRYTAERHLTLQVTALYWHFVNVAAAVVFLTLYLAPRG